MNTEKNIKGEQMCLSETAAREWMNRLNELRKDIAWQEEQLKQLKMMYGPGTVSLGERVIRTAGASPTEAMVIRLAGEEHKLCEMRARFDALMV